MTINIAGLTLEQLAKIVDAGAGSADAVSTSSDGTTPHLAKFTAAHTIADSVAEEVGTTAKGITANRMVAPVGADLWCE